MHHSRLHHLARLVHFKSFKPTKMLLTLFNIFLSIIELCQLVLEVNKELFRIVKRTLIASERKSVKNETVVVTGRS